MGATETVPTPRSDAVVAADTELRRAGASLRDALSEVRRGQDQASARYAAAVDEAVARMDAELEVAAADLRAAQARTRDELADALGQARDARRAWLEEARVQARLGAMEARDRVEGAREGAGDVEQRVEVMLKVLREDTTSTLAALSDQVAEAIGHVRDNVRALRR